MISMIFWIITSTENPPTEIEAHQDGNEQWKGFNVFLHVCLPVAGLALLWGQRGIFSKLLLQVDRSCIAVYCPSLSKREKLLKWASDRLPVTWSSPARTLCGGIPELWKDGSLLCTLINSVVAGACPNPHRHWKKPPLHAQALAYKYLGLVPMFTEEEFSGKLTMSQEKHFIEYLRKLQEIINAWPTNSELIHRNISSQYVARGMGLYTGEQHRKTIFYVYSNPTGRKRSNVLMYIRGPYGTKGTATISPFHNLKKIPVVNVLQNQLEATKMFHFKNEEQRSFLKTISLDFTSLISNVDDDDKKENDIPIQIEMEIDRAKVIYIPNDNGIYEINLICDGELLRGCPYSVQITINKSGKKDTFEAEYEHVEEKITFKKRRILAKVIDCIDEKIYIGNKLSKVRMKDTPESSTESENDDLTITAVTKKKDEILKTEINCSLEDIVEEINSVKNNDTDKQQRNDDIDMISDHLKSEGSVIVEGYEDTDGVELQVGTKHKLVKDCNEAKTQIIDLLNQASPDLHYNVEKTHYVGPSEETLVSELDIGLTKSTDYIRKIIQSTTKDEILEKILPTNLFGNSQDENNNTTTSVGRIKSKISLEIPSKITSKFPEDITSPICPDHIVPEVEKNSLKLLTLSEKRKILSKQDSISIPDNVDVIPETSPIKSKNLTFKQLSVLNVLESLKQPRKHSLSDTSENSLTSSVSLPNILTPADSNYGSFDEDTFKERKDYWERLSSKTSSNISLYNSDYEQKIKCTDDTDFSTKEKTSIDADPSSTVVDGNIKTNEVRLQTDSSLEDCSLIPLEERRKKLLKKMYSRAFKKVNIKPSCGVEKPKIERNYFTPILDRIQSFNKNAKVKTSSADKAERESNKTSIKSQFKNAITFFKDIEDNAKREKNYVHRKYSLEDQKISPKKTITRGGSLDIPYISDRFQEPNF